MERPGRGPDRSGLGRGAHDRAAAASRSEEHTSELQSQSNLVCRLLLEKKTRFRAGQFAAPLPRHAAATPASGTANERRHQPLLELAGPDAIGAAISTQSFGLPACTRRD